MNRPSGAKASVSLQEAIDLLPTPTATQPGGTAEMHLARKRSGKMNRPNPTVTDLRMKIESQGLSLINWKQFAPAVEHHAEVLERRPPEPTVDGKLNPVFVEWMMMLPEGHVADVIDRRTAALKILGNGVVPLQAAVAVGGLLTGVGVAA